MTHRLRALVRRLWTQGVGENGAAGNIEMLPFCLLIFIIGTLLIANAWAVIDTRTAVSSAAREATRSYVESSNAGAAQANARQAASGTRWSGTAATPEYGSRFTIESPRRSPAALG